MLIDAYGAKKRFQDRFRATTSVAHDVVAVDNKPLDDIVSSERVSELEQELVQMKVAQVRESVHNTSALENEKQRLTVEAANIQRERDVVRKKRDMLTMQIKHFDELAEAEMKAKHDNYLRALSNISYESVSEYDLLSEASTSSEAYHKLTGLQFERWCAELLYFCFGDDNHRVLLTQGSNDQGIDILMPDDGVAVQCKCYKDVLSNKAVQEACYGTGYYGMDVGVVMTNSTFTKGAIDGARGTNVYLLDGTRVDGLCVYCERDDIHGDGLDIRMWLDRFKNC